MKSSLDYVEKFERSSKETVYHRLSETEQTLVRDIAYAYRLSHQDIRFLVDAARDLSMWGGGGLSRWWREEGQGPRTASEASDASPASLASTVSTDRRRQKTELLNRLREHLDTLRARPKSYSPQGPGAALRRPRKPLVARSSDKKIHGMCPVASEKTVCCNLRVIDAVENCVFGCSYCTVQTFYQRDIVFDTEFTKKLEAIPIDPERFYHYGTGQASDSLAWGNKNGILDALCRFARKHPNVVLEFKTKSDNVSYLMRQDVPENVVCSWSLNTSRVIVNEEHFTASLDGRLDAARRVADRGIGVGFHFHPMVHYEGWEQDYRNLAETVCARFAPHEVRFVSFGSVTLIKPVIRKIREVGNSTRILQMPLVPDPHGKLTYPDAVKVSMFGSMYDAFTAWHNEVFFYLCMEKREIWEAALGFVYPDNDAFERDFAARALRRGRCAS